MLKLCQILISNLIKHTKNLSDLSRNFAGNIGFSLTVVCLARYLKGELLVGYRVCVCMRKD